MVLRWNLWWKRKIRPLIWHWIQRNFHGDNESGNLMLIFRENPLKNGQDGVFRVLELNCVTWKWLGRGMCFVKVTRKLQVKAVENALFTLFWDPKRPLKDSCSSKLCSDSFSVQFLESSDVEKGKIGDPLLAHNFDGNQELPRKWY